MKELKRLVMYQGFEKNFESLGTNKVVGFVKD